jgi:multiple sugar transport system ATP-binding protein
MNFVPVKVGQSGSNITIDAGAFTVTLPDHKAESVQSYVGKECVFGIRPEDIYDRNLEGLVKPTEGNTIKVGVDVVEPLGNDVEMYLTAGSHNLIAMIDSKTQARSGETIEVVLDMEKSHLFDKETEKALY